MDACIKSGMRYVCLYNGRKNRFYENAAASAGRHYGGKKVKKLTQVVNIGLSIENIGLYDDMTVYQNMKYYAKLSGGCDKRKIEETLQRMGLTDRKNMRFAKLSLA